MVVRRNRSVTERQTNETGHIKWHVKENEPNEKDTQRNEFKHGRKEHVPPEKEKG